MKRTALILIVALVAATAMAGPPSHPYTRNVAIIIYDGVEILDLGGPAEVLESAGRFGRNGDDSAFQLYTVAPHKDPVLSQQFIHIVPDYTPADAPAPDIVIIPGGSTGAIRNDPAFMTWIGQTMDHAVTLTVCSGASVAAGTGRLDGSTITTWHGLVDSLDRRVPAVKVVHGKRFIDNGNVITTAGVSAGIDGALHLTARLLGLDVAMRTAQYMEYRWTPEAYLFDSYPLLNPSLDEHGQQAQLAAIQMRDGNVDAAIELYRQALEGRDGPTDTWFQLGRALSRAERWDEAIDAFQHAAANPRVAAAAWYDAACASARKGDRQGALDGLRKAVDAGFRAKSSIASDQDLASLHGDAAFQSILDSL